MKRLSAAPLATVANRRCAALLVALLLLAACGQKGPLYLPGHSKDTPWPVRTNPPASAATPQPGAVAPGPAAGSAGAGTPAPDVKADQAGANAKDGTNSSGAGPGPTQEKPGDASQTPQ